jgi:hypothetical protein
VNLVSKSLQLYDIAAPLNNKKILHSCFSFLAFIYCFFLSLSHGFDGFLIKVMDQ